MKSFFEQLNTEAQKLSLSVREKDAMQARLEAHMRANPVLPRPIPSPYFSFVLPRALVPVLVLALVVVSGGAAYAEGALPGDVFYPIKVSINEPLREALAFSSESKAEVHAAIAETRLLEAEQLAVNGTLTPTAKAELAANFDEHANEVQKLASDVESKNPVAAADISARFASAIAAHGALIARIGDDSKNKETKSESGDLAVEVESRGHKNDSIGTTLAMQATSAPTPKVAAFAKATLAPPAPSSDDTEIVKRLGDKTLKVLTEADEKLDTLNDRLTASTTVQIRTRINDLRESVAQVEIEGDGATARREIQEILTDAVTLRAFLEAGVKFQTNILPPFIEKNDGPGSESNWRPATQPAVGL